MAIFGDAVIRPLSPTTAQKHYLHDLTIEVPTDQDGVWSTGHRETVVENLHIDGGAGSVGYGYRITQSTYVQTVMGDEPVAYWRLDETSGTDAADSAGHSSGPFNATYVGSPTLNQPGVMKDGSGSPSVDFDAGPWVAGSDWAALEFTGFAPFSLEAWFNTDTVSTTDIIVAKQENAGNDGWTLDRASSGVRISRSGSALHIADGGTVVVGKNHHVVGTYDGTTLKIYLDGIKVGDDTDVVSMGANSIPLVIGRDSAINFFHFDGRIDEVAIYDQALTETEIAGHYAIGTETSIGNGHYSAITIRNADIGVWVEASGVQLSDIVAKVSKLEGILVAGNLNQITDVIIDTPSFQAANVNDGILCTGDNNMFNNVAVDAATVAHRWAVQFTGTGNRLNGGRVVPGLTGTFLETTPGDNDFGLDFNEWDHVGVITTATGGIRFPILVASELLYVEVSVGTAPTGAPIIVDMNKNGTSVFPTTPKPTIALTEFTDIAIPDTTALVTGDYLTVDIDQADSDVVAANLSVIARYRPV